MKKTFFTAILFAGIFSMLVAPVRASVAVSVSIYSFHESLAPYGRWVGTSSYGEVWAPGGVASEWEPYWDGEWIWTDYGWTWVSSDPWGDVPYHYGTWVWVDPYGWVWVPGTVWAPAWVTWAWTDDYIGWAPVPATFVFGSTGYAGPAVVVASSRYVFVPATRFVGVNVRTARVPASQNATFLPRAQKATRFSVSGGIVRTVANPPRSFVERVSKKRIETASIERLKTRPTTVAAAHISGNRVRVAEPARERARAMAHGRGEQPKAETGKPPRESTARSNTGKKAIESTKEGHSSKPHSSSSAPAAVPSREEHGAARVHEADHSPKKRSPETTGKHEEMGKSSGKAHKEEKHPQAGPPPSHDVEREGRHTEAQSPPREGHGNPHPGPPPGQAAKPQPQPQPAPAGPAPKGKGKEKEKNHE